MRALLGRVCAAAAVVILAAGFAQPASAEGKVCNVCQMQADEAYASKAGKTLVRGGANALLGWTELFRQPVEETKAGGNVLVGVAHGIGHTVTRTLGGLGDVVTFWTPKVNGKYAQFSKDCPICMGQAK